MIRILSLAVVALGVATALDDSTQIDHKRLYSSQIDVVSPENLLGEIDHRGALFGQFPVGESIQANLYYTRKSLCGNETAGTPAVIRQQQYFLLVDRGGCSFVEKARNAQKDNVTALLIADNRCLCSASSDVCQADQQCQESLPAMDNDGTGSDIRIPSMLVSKPDADRLKNELLSGNTVELQITWVIPQAVNGVTEYTLWMTPDETLNQQFLFSFLNAALELGDKAVFRPRMFVHDGTQKGCRRYGSGEDPCPGSCTNYGRYCAPRSVYDYNSYKNKGTLMIVESLRRSCIWNIYGEPNGIGYEWWAYVQSWISRCGNSRFSATCAESIYRKAGIDMVLVEQCMMASGNFRNNTANAFLDQNLEEADDYDVTFSPTLFVNGAIVRGALTFGTVLEAICMTYAEDDIPQVCYDWQACSQNCPDGQVCVVQNGQCILYEVPSYDEFESTWDDDYLTSPAFYEEAAGVTTAPTVAVVTPVPTKAPVQVVTGAPSGAPTVAVVKEVPVPVPMPVEPPVPRPSGTELGTPPTSSGVSEPIQIIEHEKRDNYESKDDRGVSFEAGLGIGLGASIFAVLLAYVIIRERRRNARAHAAYASRKIQSAYFDDGGLEDDAVLVGEYDDNIYVPRSSRARVFQPRRLRVPRIPRRFVQRPRQKSLVYFQRKRTLQIPVSDEEEEVAFQPRQSMRSKHSRRFREEMLDADSELESAMVDELEHDAGSSFDDEY